MTTLRHRIATDTRYNMAGFPTAVLSFSLVVAGVSAGIGSTVAFVGLPILAATAAMARNFADAELATISEVLGRPLARPAYPQAPAGAGWFRRMMNPLANGQSWIDLIYAVVAFPLAVASFAVTAVWWAGAIAGLTFPLYGWILAAVPGVSDGGVPALLGIGHDPATFVIFNTAIGVLFALTLPPVVRGTALMRASLAQALLTRPVYDPRRVGAAAAAGV
ncbi:sensor domain-containing protein [Nonomuraea sp. NPDC000554]|uniref:sensor domain-containing protein n=1 Tax=Nonomuraea sp. NPDC000554 TaxID=3154259 RepID=UPI003324B820